jgi:hypothetical protein
MFLWDLQIILQMLYSYTLLGYLNGFDYHVVNIKEFEWGNMQ